MWWSCRALLLAAAAAETLQRVSLGTHGSQESQDSRLHRAASLRCEDLRDDCNEVVGPLLENCGQDPSDVLMKCMKSCGACDYATLVEEAMQCADTNAECASWAASGECQTNPHFEIRKVAQCASLNPVTLPSLEQHPQGQGTSWVGSSLKTHL